MITKEIADDVLPDEPTSAITNPTRLKYLIIAPPKWGKTTFACDAPESILLATEEGHAFHETRKLIIDCWAYQTHEEEKNRAWGKDEDGNVHTSMELAADALAVSSKYQFVAIDTADMAAKMCTDYWTEKLKITHASDMEWGKGWDLTLTKPFRVVLNKIMKSGRGIAFITHLAEREVKLGNQKIKRWETTLPSQVQKFLHTQADVIIHGQFGLKRSGMPDRDRIVYLDGSNEILAGSRVRGLHLPAKYIVDPEHPWQQFAAFFDDKELVEEAEKEYDLLFLKGKESDVRASESDETEPKTPQGGATTSKKTKK